MKQLQINEELEGQSLQPFEDCNRYNLFKDIMALEYWGRKAGEWICEELKCKLMKLFELYPAEHAEIKRALKISNSTYHRLIKERCSESYEARSKKRVERSKKELDVTERILVKQMVFPPAISLTLNQI